MLPRLLVLDDDALLHRSIERQAQRAGWAVLHAVDNRGALASIARDRPDVVLQDVNRPEGCGYALLAALRAERRPVPVVVLSGYYSQGVALRLGAVDTWDKPCDTVELLASLVRAAEYGRRVRALGVRPIENAEAPVPAELVGIDGALMEVKLAFARLAATDAPLLVRAPGERCAERVGRVAHALSRRDTGPFVVVSASDDGASNRARLFDDPILGAGAVARARRGTLVVREPQKLGEPELGALLDALAREDAPRLVAVDEAPLGEARLFDAVGGDVSCLPALATRSAADQRRALRRLAAECSDEGGHSERSMEAPASPDATFLERRRALAASRPGA